MRKKHPGPPSEPLPKALKGMLATIDDACFCQPWLHVNCSGCIEVENCRGVLDYSPEAITLDMGAASVSIRGDSLEILSLTGHETEISGDFFEIRFNRR